MTRVTVEGLGQQGDGIVRIDGQLLHVPKVLPGEVIDIERDRLKRIVAASPQRGQPFCKHFERCGGCKFQHWREADYACWKRQMVVDALRPLGIDIEVGALVDAHGNGRRRVVMHVREIDGVWCAGFMEAKSHRLAAIDVCPVLEPELQHAPEVATAFGPVLGPCDVSITHADNGLDVAVKAERSAVARRLPVLQSLFRGLGITRLSVNGEILFAETQPFVTIGKARLPLPITAFLQATQTGEGVLAAGIAAALRKSKRVTDLFCGIGPFALRLAEHASVHAVDADKPAIAALALAVKHTQGLKPLTTEVRDLFRNPLVPQELNAFDGVVFDPPRAGAEAQARAIAKSKVKRVAAVACDARTFARDMRILMDGGYTLLSVTPVDQFKWTAHVEILAMLQR